jgi:Lrp/AsnC family transcriptional regulator, leucine-responsive regulatory protein
MLDQTDKDILRLVQSNAKMSIKQISLSVNKSTTAVFERIKGLEEDGYIEQYYTKLDRKKLGLNLMVLCNIVLKKHQSAQIKKFERDIIKFDSVIACYHVAGAHDYTIQVCVKDMEEFQSFVSNDLASISNISNLQSSFIMKEVGGFRGLPID